MATKKVKDRLEEMRSRAVGVDKDGVYRKAAPTSEELAIKRLDEIRNRRKERAAQPVELDPKVKARKELEQLRTTYAAYEKPEMQGIADNRSWEEIYAENEERNKISQRIKMLENQMQVDESEAYYQEVLKRLSKLDEETVSYVDQLNAGMPDEGLQMQGVSDNRSWEDRYAEQQNWENELMRKLSDKGYSQTEITQMRKDRERQVNRENYETEIAESQQEATDNGFLASVKSIPQNLTGGLGTISLAVQNAHKKRTGDDTPVDYYTPEMIGQAKAQAARQTVTKRLERNDRNVAAFLYNTGMSMADSAVVAGMAALGVPPAAGTALLGGSAAIQAARDAKERGVSDEQALWTGLAAGAAEMIFEKISLDRLLATSPTEGVFRQRFLQTAKNIGKQSFTEGSEELFTSVANSLADAVINGEKSYYNQSVYNYMMQGMEYGEAVQAATRDWAASLAQDFLAGAISGGVMGGVTTGIVTGIENQRTKSLYEGSEQDLVDEALEIDPKNEAALYAKKRLENGESVSGAVLRSLVRQNQRKIDAGSESAAESAEETGEETQDTPDVSGGAEAKRTAVSTVSHATDFTEEEARYIVEEGAKEFGNAASSVVNSYMRSQDPQLYMAQAKLAFNYGKTMSEEKGLPYALKSPALKSLDETQIRSLFNAGRMQAKSIPVSAVKGTGKAVMTDGLDYTLLSPVQKKQVDALSAFAKASGYTIEFFESKVGEDGRYTAEQGSFNTKTGVIRIDINAGRDKVTDLTNYAMVRVASHEITHSFKKNAPQQYVALRDYVTGVLADKGRFEDLVDTKMRDLGIDHETAVDEVVADGCEMLLRDTRFAEQLAKENRTLFEKIRDAIRKFVKKLRDAFEGVEIAHEEALLLKDAENLQKLWDEALAKSVENVAAAEEIGFDIDTTTESVAASLHSERTWTESEYVQQRTVAAKEISKAIGVSEQKALDYIDSVNSIAKMIAEDRTRLDYFSSPYRSSFVSNVEYGGSFDFSTLCKKRRLLTGTFTAIQRALPNTALTADEILDIRNRMKEAGLEVSCGLCYVEGSRANMGQFAKEFIRLYKQYYPNAWHPNMADVNTPDGIEWVRINHPECYEQYEYFWNHYGTLRPGDKNLFASQQKPKLYQLHTEYKGEVLEKFKGEENIAEKNRNGGIRMQSFSDFEIVHLIDCMQIIMDMSRVGLAGQAYTEVPDFAWAMGDTGMKINLSLIAKGVDENGKLIFDDVEGMPIEEAMKLRDRYSKNVGTILVAFNDEQLYAAMADERVDFIIPFHRSQWKKSQYTAMGLPAKTKDYTFMQNEKFIKPQYHEYRGRQVKDKATNYMPNEYWDFSKSGKENAIAYLEMCAKNNKRPKFYKLLQNNGDGSYSLKADGSTDGYWKLLIDFKMYDNDGVGSPQTPVRPDFNMEEATRMLNEYKGGHSQFPVAQGIVDEFVEEYKGKHGDVMYSKRSFSKKDYAKVKDARVEMYRGMSEEDIPDIDYISSAEYNKVNEASLYIVKNSGYLDFEIIDKRRIKGRFETEIEKGHRDGKVGKRTGENDGRERIVSTRHKIGDRSSGYDGGLHEDEGRTGVDGGAGQTDGAGTGAENHGVSYSFRTGYIPTDRSILASYVPKDSDSNMIKRHIAEYQKSLEELRKLEQTLREQREQMRSLTGDENKVQRAKLREEIVKTQNRIQIANDQLRRKESWMGVRTVLNREKDALVKQAKAEEREKLTKYREQRWDTENRRKMRERISYRVKTLDKMLRNPTDDKHIPDGLQSAILDFCEAFTENTSVFSKKRLDSIRAEYSALEGKVSETSLADLYDESIKEMLEYLNEVMAGKRLSELDMEQLSMVRAIADHFAFMVKNENEIFVQGRKVKLDETAQGVIFAANEHKRLLPEISKGEALDAFDKILTSGNLRPVNFFRDKGSDMRGLFQSLLDAQDEYAFRMDAAKAFVEDVKKSTGYSEWSGSEQTLEFTNAAGQKVKLDIQQAMSLLATYERELRSGNLVHVTQGGFVYEKDVTGDIFVGGVKVPVLKQVVQAEKAKAHPMSVEDMDKVRSWLGEVDSRVLDYMEKMVEYLSTTMSEYGNETSMQLHGYKKFGEGYYFPIKSAKEFLQQEPGKAGFDDSRWKHKGFTKATVKGANNPFVLRSFDEVWSNHVSQMCMYSTMAVPQDAFVRVMNYKTPVDPTGSTASVSVKSEIRGNYGQKSLDYIDTYLSDINGGLLTDPRAGALNRMVSLFKKNAVFASLSVALQQPSAIVRAMTMVDGKYFAKAFQSKPAFEEAKQYSGLAIIKQIGGFDTTTGRGGAEWLMQTTPEGLKAKAKAFVQFGEKDTGYRDSLMTILPQKMDEISWGYLWNAVKAEIADTTNLEVGTEAFFEAVAKRFEEVIENTQVYDSVLTRSENMRGKDGLIKAATSFMAEPTVTMNMFSVAVQDALAGKEGAKAHLARTALVLALSIVVNNLLKAIATAPRDKDEDETIAEKYLETVVSGVKSDFDPFGYAPILRDVKSIWQGYTVEASYASVISDIYDAWNKFSKNQTVESGFDVVNSVAALFGVPAKNLKRDIMSAINIFAKTAPLSETSKRGFWNAFREGWGVMPGVDDAIEKAYKADKRGNEAQRKKALEELRQLYEDKAKQFRLEGKQDAAQKAKSSLKSSITAELKPLYQAATTQAEKNRIKSLALRVYVGGEQLYNGYDFERYWGEE